MVVLSKPSKPIFYCRFVDEIYSRWKLGDNVIFDRLKNYHPNIKLTIKVNPSKFLDTKLGNINDVCKFNIYRKNTKLPSILDKAFGEFFTFQHNFSSPQVKRNQIIITRKYEYELPHEMLSDLRLRILGNQEISRKSLKCLDLIASTQPSNQKPNFDVFE